MTASILKLQAVLVLALCGFCADKSVTFASTVDEYHNNDVIDRSRRSADVSDKVGPVMAAAEEDDDEEGQGHQLEVAKRLPRLGRRQSPFSRIGGSDEEDERQLEKRLPRLGRMLPEKRLPRLGKRLPRLGKRLPRLGRSSGYGYDDDRDDEDEVTNGVPASMDKRLPRLGEEEDRKEKRLPRLGRRSPDPETVYDEVDEDESLDGARGKRLPRLGRRNVDLIFFDENGEEELNVGRLPRIGLLDKRTAPRLDARSSPFPRMGERSVATSRISTRASPFPRLG